MERQPTSERARQIVLSDLYIAAVNVMRLYDRRLLLVMEQGTKAEFERAFRELHAAIKSCER